jgi:hypothetical protein
MPSRAVTRGVIAAVAVAAVATVASVVLQGAREQENSNGTGANYRGEFYSLSAGEVRAARLGAVLARDLGFQDTTTDLRVIRGIDPHTAVAARIAYAPGTPAERGPAWLLMSPDPDLAADPWATPDLQAVLRPATE